MKTAKLISAALDWAVATAEGEKPEILSNHTITEAIAGIRKYRITIVLAGHETWQATYSPSTDWALGGPIIEREFIELLIIPRDTSAYWKKPASEDVWSGFKDIENKNGTLEFGSTPLIAAMRCYVASRLGSEIEIPEELT